MIDDRQLPQGRDTIAIHVPLFQYGNSTKLQAQIPLTETKGSPDPPRPQAGGFILGGSPVVPTRDVCGAT